MKININIDKNYAETEITINCAVMSDEMEKVIASLRTLDFKLTGTKDGQTHILDASQILRSEERRVGKECRSRWSPYH